MGAPQGNKNAEGPHKTAQRAAVLRSDDHGLQELKDRAAGLTKLPSFQKRFAREQAKYEARHGKKEGR